MQHVMLQSFQLTCILCGQQTAGNVADRHGASTDLAGMLRTDCSESATLAVHTPVLPWSEKRVIEPSGQRGPAYVVIDNQD